MLTLVVAATYVRMKLKAAEEVRINTMHSLYDVSLAGR
jgi:hypothetical protein